MAPHPHLGYANPVVDHDFPDPGIFYDRQAGTWYAFSTNANGKNIQCSYSTDFCCWTHHDKDCLPESLPPWTSGAPGFLWAPEVVPAPQGRGGFLMYLTAQDTRFRKQCIGAAYSQHSPLGPYRWVSNGPIISRPFDDPVSGRRFLVFKSDLDKMYTLQPQLWLQVLSEDGLTLEDDMVPLLAPTMDYQCKLLEAPYLTYHQPSGTYVLFYSSGTFSNKSYATSYAISRNGICGPYQPASGPLLCTDEARKIYGPGGACIVEGVEGHTFIVFHALQHEGGPRKMCIHRLEWTPDGIPYLPGRPNCGKRLRLCAEQEDDQEHFRHHQHHQPNPVPVPEAATHGVSGGGHGDHDKYKNLAKKLGGALKKLG
ncbi:related to Endo-1,4-beta-xylanase [Pseudozyma flocculosa]|uniref:Related to Endo-1,4-beta-xylanase n=1 Tax=Pseudozyma flocculosa TaxID=84751 RepID=A0A5C3ERV3_9BASI|nr:related to Endo-1,4-beta-xylanase [Pseudozyma flocculosa]